MRVGQTISRAGGACLLLLAACISCAKRGELRKPRPRSELPPPAASEDAHDASLIAPAVAQALRAVHEQKLEIAPPNIQSPRLSFGRGRLLQAASNQVALWDTKQGTRVATAELDSVRAVASGSDGALFAIGRTGGVRFAAESSLPNRFAHVTFLPGSGLFPDLEDPSYFYVYQSGAQLDRYSFEGEGGALLTIDAQFSLDACTAAVALLRDGAFVCRNEKGIARKAPRGVPHEFALPAGVAEPIRLLPARRFDELFSVSRNGEVVHWRLETGCAVLGRFQLPALPFAAVGNGEALAFVLVDPPGSGQSRRWRLFVTDLDGRVRLEVLLPEKSTSASDDWITALTEDKNLAISGFEPLVAVGGAQRFGVWDYVQGHQVFAE